MYEIKEQNTTFDFLETDLIKVILTHEVFFDSTICYNFVFLITKLKFMCKYIVKYKLQTLKSSIIYNNIDGIYNFLNICTFIS